MIKKLVSVAALLALAACGGGGDSPTSPTTQAPTPVPVSYAGTYRGTMLDNAGGSLVRFDGEVSVTASGTTVNADYLLLTSALGTVTRYPVGTAALTGGEFRIVDAYTSKGCGSVVYTAVGRYSGDGGLLNLTYTGTTASCGQFDIRGELRR
jgi:hypothetical protein